MISGNLEECLIQWSLVTGSLHYQVDVKIDSAPWVVYKTNVFGSQTTYPDISPSVRKIQFRVKSICAYLHSNWTVSNILEFRPPQADFIVKYNDTEYSQLFYVGDLGDSIELIDNSTESDLPLITKTWRIYSDATCTNLIYTGTGDSLVYVCDTRGLFAVSLTVEDSVGLSSTKTITQMFGVECYIEINFIGSSISSGASSQDFLDVSVGEALRFTVDVYGSVISRYNWKFYADPEGHSYSLESTLISPSNRYYKLGNYAVGLDVIGEFGQRASLIKPSFIRVISNVSTTTTTTTQPPITVTTFTTVSTTTTFATTLPPTEWLKIPYDGIPIASSEKDGFESYKAFDIDGNSEWRPETEVAYTYTTTTTVSSSSSSSTTLPGVVSEHDKLWYPSVDVKHFRDNFIDIFLNNGIFKVRCYDGLPSVIKVLHQGTLVFDNETNKFYVGTDVGWTSVNQTQVSHAVQHTSGGSDELIVISNNEPVRIPKGLLWIDTSLENISTTTTTATTTTASSTYSWNGNIAVSGPWGYNEGSSYYDSDTRLDYAFNSSVSTYWKSLNVPSDEDPEWIGYYWSIPRAIRVYRVYRENDDGIPCSWELKASNNGLVWITLHSVRDSVTGLSEYVINNATPYHYYRLWIYETHDDRNIRIYSLEFFEQIPLLSSTTLTTISTTLTSSTNNYF
jgi:hypothetical protein